MKKKREIDWDAFFASALLISSLVVTAALVVLGIIEIVAQFKFDGQYITWRWISIVEAFK